MTSPSCSPLQGGVATITLNRPAKMNALNPEMIVRLARYWDQVDADPTVRVAILTGAGEANVLRRRGPGQADAAR